MRRDPLRPLVAATRNSLAGLRDALSERSVRQEAVVIVAAIPATVLIAPDLFSGVVLVASLLVVLAVELLNSALEVLADHVTPERHEAIRRVKDIGSAAVMVAIVQAALLWSGALIVRLGLAG